MDKIYFSYVLKMFSIIGLVFISINFTFGDMFEEYSLDKIGMVDSGIYGSSCMINSNGTLMCRGRGPYVGKEIPLSDYGVKHVDLSQNVACIINREDKLFCLGSGSRTGIMNFDSWNVNIKKVLVSDSSEKICAFNSSGSLRCWHTHNSRASVSVPAPWNENVIDISMGLNSVCVLRNDNNFKCFGGLQPIIPERAQGNIRSIDSANIHNCVISYDDELFCSNYSYLPRFITTGVKNIDLGSYHGCIILLNGTGNCQGILNNFRQLQIPNGWKSNVKRIYAKEEGTCITLETGYSRCWGSNDNNIYGKYYPKYMMKTFDFKTQDLCSQNIQISTIDFTDELLLDDILVSVNNISKNTLGNGFVDFNLNNFVCDEKLLVKGICSDGVRLCSNTSLLMKNGSDSSFIDCSVCSLNSNVDLLIKKEDLQILENKVNLVIGSKGFNGEISISIVIQGDNGLIKLENEETMLVGIGKNNFTLDYDFEKGDLISILVEGADELETDLSNNFLQSEYMFSNKVFLDIGLSSDFSVLEIVFKDFIGSRFDLVESRDEADLILVIGENSIFKYFTEFDKEFIELGLRDYSMPYSSYVFSRNSLVKKEVFIFSNGIWGDIIGLRKFVYGDFGYEFGDFEFLVDDYSKEGLSIMDLLSYDSLGDDLYSNGEVLAQETRDVLYDFGVNSLIRIVKTSNGTSYGNETILRVKNLEINYSKNFEDVFKKNFSPVVMAGGIYTNIDAFVDFGLDLAKDGQDVFLAEITGGPGSEDGINYTYSDLENFYVPTILAGVQNISGSQKLNYVGHSNGCRSALTSLSKHYVGISDVGEIFNPDNGEWEKIDLLPNSINTFFGIACPTVLNEIEWSTEKIRKHDSNGLSKGENAINKLRDEGLVNIDQNSFLRELDPIAYLKLSLKENNLISLNLQDFYTKLYLNNDSNLELNQNAANNFLFFAGIDNYLWFDNYGGDGVVPLEDLKLLNSFFNMSELFIINNDHTKIQKNEYVESVISERLKDE